MLKELGARTQYVRLLLLRLPFEAIRNLIYAVFLKFSFEAIQELDNKRLCLVCAGFLAANIFLFSYNGTVWRFFGTFYARLQKKLKVFIITKLLDKPLEEIDNRANDTEGSLRTGVHTAADRVETGFENAHRTAESINELVQNMNYTAGGMAETFS